MTSAFENLAGPSKPLRAEPFDRNEFEGLKTSGQVRLRDASNPSLALESRFDLAYNAAHALCLAALRYHGYRSSNRYIVFQLLPNTLQLGPEVWRVLAKCHNLRNLSEYEGDLNIDEQITKDLVSACQIVANTLDQLDATN
ncbi:MAG: hypothetical protein LRY56_06190 [Burkholderiaceae bacterium]|nr:hypothetical protein [Burkholderiaceae bacterium]MCD8537093.1 hypothetical protein [Burkholderiaceae bacterium]